MAFIIKIYTNNLNFTFVSQCFNVNFNKTHNTFLHSLSLGTFPTFSIKKAQADSFFIRKTCHINEAIPAMIMYVTLLNIYQPSLKGYLLSYLCEEPQTVI